MLPKSPTFRKTREPGHPEINTEKRPQSEGAPPASVTFRRRDYFPRGIGEPRRVGATGDSEGQRPPGKGFLCMRRTVRERQCTFAFGAARTSLRWLRFDCNRSRVTEQNHVQLSEGVPLNLPRGLFGKRTQERIEGRKVMGIAIHIRQFEHPRFGRDNPDLRVPGYFHHGEGRRIVRARADLPEIEQARSSSPRRLDLRTSPRFIKVVSIRTQDRGSGCLTELSE